MINRDLLIAAAETLHAVSHGWVTYVRWSTTINPKHCINMFHRNFYSGCDKCHFFTFFCGFFFLHTCYSTWCLVWIAPNWTEGMNYLYSKVCMTLMAQHRNTLVCVYLYDKWLSLLLLYYTHLSQTAFNNSMVVLINVAYYISGTLSQLDLQSWPHTYSDMVNHEQKVVVETRLK